jgi:hypothetical protein
VAMGEEIKVLLQPTGASYSKATQTMGTEEGSKDGRSVWKLYTVQAAFPGSHCLVLGTCLCYQ